MKQQNRQCIICQNKISSGSRSGFCRKCAASNPNRKNIEYCPEDLKAAKQTKGELFKKRKNWQSARTAIRKHAARVVKSNNILQQCKICGYTKFVEICHIKPVKDFDDSCYIQEINDIENLIILCPNHHTEYDNGLLDSDLT